MTRFSSSAGRNGVSITLVTQYDIHLVHSIEGQIRKLVGYETELKSGVKLVANPVFTHTG